MRTFQKPLECFVCHNTLFTSFTLYNAAASLTAAPAGNACSSLFSTSPQ